MLLVYPYASTSSKGPLLCLSKFATLTFLSVCRWGVTTQCPNVLEPREPFWIMPLPGNTDKDSFPTKGLTVHVISLGCWLEWDSMSPSPCNIYVHETGHLIQLLFLNSYWIVASCSRVTIIQVASYVGMSSVTLKIGTFLLVATLHDEDRGI